MATLCAFVCGSGFAVHSIHAALTGAHQVTDLYSSALLLLTCSAIESYTLFVRFDSPSLFASTIDFNLCLCSRCFVRDQFAWRQCRAEAARLGVSPAAYVFDRSVAVSKILPETLSC
jgi:hypothetical protein